MARRYTPALSERGCRHEIGADTQPSGPLPCRRDRGTCSGRGRRRVDARCASRPRRGAARSAGRASRPARHAGPRPTVLHELLRPCALRAVDRRRHRRRARRGHRRHRRVAGRQHLLPRRRELRCGDGGVGAAPDQRRLQRLALLGDDRRRSPTRTATATRTSWSAPSGAAARPTTWTASPATSCGPSTPTPPRTRAGCTRWTSSTTSPATGCPRRSSEPGPTTTA